MALNLLLALTLATSTPAFAKATAGEQEKPLTTTKEMDATVKVTVTGETDLDYVWRRREITAFTGGVSGTSIPGNSESENTFEGFVALRMTADLSDQISAIVEIGTKRVDAGVIHYFAGGNATTTGGVALPIQLREAHVLIKELLMPELSLQMGITTWGFDLRGKGQSMAFDVRHSQRFIRNLSASGDGPGTLAARAGDPQELEPAGFWLHFGRERFSVDLVALPAVIEGGSLHNDESFYAVDLIYTMDAKGSRLGLIMAVTNDPGGRSTIYTYGGGANWKGFDSLDLYAEVYFQNGWNNGPAPGLPPVKVGAFAVQVGAEYALPGDLKPWVGANLTFYSGDDDAAANGKSSTFNSYENIHDLMILEDMLLGFDWDANYRAIKVSGGVALTAARQNDLRIWTMIGFTQTVKTVRFANGNTHKLGNEIDLHADWELTKQVTVNLGIGYLFGSKVLENSMGGPGAPDAKRQTLLFTLGTDLKF